MARKQIRMLPCSRARHACIYSAKACLVLLTRQTRADAGIIPPSERLRLFGRRNKKRA